MPNGQVVERAMLLQTEYDGLSESGLSDAVYEFFRTAEDRYDQYDEIHYAYNSLLPRLNFMKNVRRNSTILDLGAGDGALSVYRDWPLNKRSDMRMLALSLIKGESFDNYESYELKNFEETTDIFTNENIDSVICCHFIEHMKSPDSTIQFLARRLKNRSRVYLEWPHEISKRMPPRLSLIENGHNVSTTRFDDDGTHVETWNMDLIVELLGKHGFKIETVGRVIMPNISADLRDVSKRNNEIVGNTLSLWTYFGWAQYVIAWADFA